MNLPKGISALTTQQHAAPEALTLHIDVTPAQDDLVDQSGGMVIHFFLFVFALGLPEKRYMVNGYGQRSSFINMTLRCHFSASHS